MPRLAANLSYLFTERPFLDRFEAAARCGFRAVEHQFPYREASESAIQARLRDHDLCAVLFNLPPGEEGERGLGGLPGRVAEFREGLDLALRYCRATGCPRLHAMWGVPDAHTSLEESRATFVANLREAAPRAAEAGVTLLVEPLNPRDNPGYPLNRQADAHALVAEVGAPNVKVQFDLYHCQIVEGDVATKLRRWLGGPESNVGHIQIAGPPDRGRARCGGARLRMVAPAHRRVGIRGMGRLRVPARGRYRGGPRLGARLGDPPAAGGRRSLIGTVGFPPPPGTPSTGDGGMPGETAMTAEVLYEEVGGIAIVAINRPEKKNTLTENVVRGIADGIDAASRSKDVAAWRGRYVHGRLRSDR